MQPTSIQLSFSQAKADPSIAWARYSLVTAIPLLWSTGPAPTNQLPLYLRLLNCFNSAPLWFQLRIGRNMVNLLLLVFDPLYFLSLVGLCSFKISTSSLVELCSTIFSVCPLVGSDFIYVLSFPFWLCFWSWPGIKLLLSFSFLSIVLSTFMLSCTTLWVRLMFLATSEFDSKLFGGVVETLDLLPFYKMEDFPSSFTMELTLSKKWFISKYVKQTFSYLLDFYCFDNFQDQGYLCLFTNSRCW